MTFPDPCLLTPDGALDVDALLAFHRARFGDAQMFESGASLVDGVKANRDSWRDQRESIDSQMRSLLDTCEVRGDNRLKADEQRRYDDLQRQRDGLSGQIDEATARIEELLDQNRRSLDANAARAAAGDVGEQHFYTTDSAIYASDRADTSFFSDLYLSTRRADVDAADRIRRNSAMTKTDLSKRWDSLGTLEKRFYGSKPETRALSTTLGGVGEFAPPLWLVEDFVKFARPGRVFADSLNPMPLPSGVSSINIPKVSGGATTAIQTSQNSALSQTDMTSTSLSSSISTIGGKQVVSAQLVQQSGVPFDQVILQDLAEDYAQRLDIQSISGSGSSGQLEGVETYFAASGHYTTAYTTGAPVVSGTTTTGFYQQIFMAWSDIAANRFMTPDTIWMHPRRWAWILMAADSSNRPLVVPNGNAFNPLGGEVSVDVAQGVVGNIGGLQVIIDANIPTNLGAGTNQDPCIVGVRGDLRLWESPIQLEAFDSTYADSAGILFRALGYAGAIPSRYTTSCAVILGTGMIKPF